MFSPGRLRGNQPDCRDRNDDVRDGNVRMRTALLMPCRSAAAGLAVIVVCTLRRKRFAPMMHR
jgi:hypothetical protein